MATAAFDWQGDNGNPDPSSFLTYFQDEGVPPGPANELPAQVGHGGPNLARAPVHEAAENVIGLIACGPGPVAVVALPFR